MSYDQFRHHRDSVRFRPGDGPRGGKHDRPYRYITGIFYVTICTHDRECLFGEVAQRTIHLNECGRIVQEEWFQVAEHRPNVTLDAFIVMPNHVHGIMILRETATPNAEPRFSQMAPGSLAAVVGGFKSAVSRCINIVRDTPGAPVWQRGYHDRIVYDERMLNNARRYIAANPSRWTSDIHHPDNPPQSR